MATAAAMAELWQRHTRGGAKRNAAYQWRGCGRCKAGRVEQGEATLECGRLEARVAVSAGELDGAAATAMVCAVSKGARGGE